MIIRILTFFLAALLGVGIASEAAAQVSWQTIKRHAGERIKARFIDHSRPEHAVRPVHKPDVRRAKSESTEAIVSNAESPESEIAAIANPSDSSRMVAVVMGAPPENPAGLTFPIYYSRDFGETWVQSDFHPETAHVPFLQFPQGGGDPVLAYDETGTLHLVWLQITIELSLVPFGLFNNSFLNHATSTDDGKTWSLQAEPAASARLGVSLEDTTGVSGSIYDKPWLISDASPNSGTGPAIHLVYTDLRYVNPDSIDYQINIQSWTSAEGWSDSRPAISRTDLPFCQFPSPTIDADGNLYVMAFGASAADPYLAQYVVRSEDGGQTFAAPSRIDYVNLDCFLGQTPSDFCITGVDPGRTIPGGYILANPVHNELYAIWYADGSRDRDRDATDVLFSRSTDRGQTWSEPETVNQDSDPTADNFLPTGVIAPNGDLFVTWYDQRNGPEATDYYAVRYDPLSATFDRDFPVTTAPTDFNDVGSANGNFGPGDYSTTLFVGDYLIPFWADGRAGNGDLDIYLARIDQAGEPVSVSALRNDRLRVSVSPNPVRETIQVELLAESTLTGLQAYVIDASGRQVMKVNVPAQLGPGQTTITQPANHLPPGTYFLLLSTAETGRITKKIIRE